MKPSPHSYRALRCASLALLSFFACAHAQAQTFAEIGRFDTIHGEVIHQEGTGGLSRLDFVTKGNKVALPKTWGRVSIEQVIDLNGQTAILLSHSESNCPSRLALAVVSRDTFWGPYAVGGCEDILIHQRSEDGNDLIAVRADTTGSLAWVYSAEDSLFRGPVTVDLPASLSSILPKTPVASPAQKVAPPLRVTTPKPSTKVPMADSLGGGEEIVRPTKTARPATKPVRTTGMTPQEASVVSRQARKAPAEKVLSINL